MSTFTCPHHGLEITDGNRDGCPACIAWLAERPAPEDMTPDARVAEMERLVDPLTIAFRTIHPRLEALVGRPVFTHEIAMCWSALLDEARTRPGIPLTPEQLAQPLIDGGQTVIVVHGERQP